MQNSEILYIKKQFEHGRKIRAIYILRQTRQNIRQIYDFLEQNDIRVLVNVGQNKLQEKFDIILYEQLDSKLENYLDVAKQMHNELFTYHNDVAIISGESLNNAIKLYLLFMKIYEGISSYQYTELSQQLNFQEVLDLKNLTEKLLYNQLQDNKSNNDKILQTGEQACSVILESPIDYSQNIKTSKNHNRQSCQENICDKKIRIISVQSLSDFTKSKQLASNPQQDQKNQSSLNDTYLMFMPPNIQNQSDQINMDQSVSNEQQINQIPNPNLPQDQRSNTSMSQNIQTKRRNLGSSVITADMSEPVQQIEEQIVYQLPQPIKFQVFKPKSNFCCLQV